MDVFVKMLKSPYKIKHWSPVKKVPKSVDQYWNVIEYEDIEADEYKNIENIMRGIKVGNGILE